jgi:2-haloacid dehalogenase
VLNLDQFRLVTFDCYGTLIDWETGILDIFRPILSAHGAHLSSAEILRLYGEIEAQEESGEYRDYKEILRSVVQAFAQRLGFTASQAEQQSLPDSLSGWKPFPDTVGALRRLKSKFKLGIISNVDEDLFFATARQLEVDFDFVVTAAQARGYKPSLSMFELAHRKVSLPVQQWLHAAQSVYHDVVPAQSLGITTVWVNRPSAYPNAGAAKPATAKPDLEVSSLEALANLAS